MANLSLREVAQSQLDQAPVIDGQLEALIEISAQDEFKSAKTWRS